MKIHLNAYGGFFLWQTHDHLHVRDAATALSDTGLLTSSIDLADETRIRWIGLS